jgi:limonene-1,2-epoxide hydrolase
MTDNERIVREFIQAWSRLDPTELVSYFAADGTYYNMPTAPVTGQENLSRFITGFIRPWESTDWEILNLLADGDIVMVERVDHTVVAGSPVDLPCLGIFEMENGKIKIWRDYFNLPTYTDALTAATQ